TPLPPGPARADRSPHRSKARHRSGEAPPDLPPPGGTGVAALDSARARSAAAAGRLRDRAALADRRAAPGKADGRAGGILGPPLLHRDLVRLGPSDPRPPGARAGRTLSRPVLRGPSLFSVRLLGRRRPGWESLRHQRSDPPFAPRVPARRATAVS